MDELMSRDKLNELLAEQAERRMMHVVALYNAGVSRESICKEMGFSSQRLSYILTKAGIRDRRYSPRKPVKGG